MKLVAAIAALVLAAILAPLLFLLADDDRPPAPETGLPWQVEPLPDGNSRVFGLTLGMSTLSEARERLGQDMQVAIVAAPGQAGSLEAYFESVTLGYVTGKLILTLEAAPDTVAGMRERAPKAEYMESTTRRYSLAAEDLALAHAAPIRALTLIPSANLDEEVVLQRFGPPAKRVRSAEHMEHFLYPEIGLDLTLDAKGKEVLQYVPPRDFERLATPLQPVTQ